MLNEKKPLKDIRNKARNLFTEADPKTDKKPCSSKPLSNSWAVVMAFLALSYIQQFFFATKIQTIPYSQFKQSIMMVGVLNQKIK